jgi:superfamily I DNA/RNA helicase
LEFNNVIIIDLNEGVIPYPSGFNGDNDDFHVSTERRLLYTAMTRAKERLYLYVSGAPSRYIQELDQSFAVVNNHQSTTVAKDVLDDLPF